MLRFMTTGVLACALAIAGCGDAGSESALPGPTPGGGGGGGGGDGDGTGRAGPAFEGGSDTGGPGMGVPGGGGEGGECDTPECEPVEVPAGQLTAGEWRDLDHWDEWLDVLDREEWSGMPEHWGYDTSGRIPVRVGSDGAPVVDARVELRDAGGATIWTARTDSHGRAEVFSGAFGADEGPWSLRVTARDEVVDVADVLPGATDAPVEVEISRPFAPGLSLDLMFVVDTTGSMGDELWYIQAELRDVIERAQAQSTQLFDLRTSLNFYRDEGDDYVVNSHPFTSDLDAALGSLAAESAAGGGDFPEAVEQALHDAIEGHEWRAEATARLLFLVLDAPPHHTPAILERMRSVTAAAAAKGIRIIPVAGSGIDKNTEFLLRFEAILTGGTYTFLTDHSGIGGSHIEPTIGAYDVEFLNDLLVRLIVDSVTVTP